MELKDVIIIVEDLKLKFLNKMLSDINLEALQKVISAAKGDSNNAK